MASENCNNRLTHQTETSTQMPQHVKQHQLQMRRNSVIPHNPLMPKGKLTYLICIHIEPIQNIYFSFRCYQLSIVVFLFRNCGLRIGLAR